MDHMSDERWDAIREYSRVRFIAGLKFDCTEK